MLKKSSIVSLDPGLKSAWFAVCESLGLTPSCCITLLAKQMVRDGSLPFTPSLLKEESNLDT